MYEEYEKKSQTLQKVAASYTKEDFAEDVSERLCEMVSEGTKETLRDTLLTTWDKLWSESKVPLYNNMEMFEFISERASKIRGKMFEARSKGDKTELDRLEEESWNNHLLLRETEENIKAHKMHRLVLEPIIKKAFSGLNFSRNENLREWKGLEVDTATDLGFGGRTSYEALTYDVEEQGREVKNTVITALAVYFMEVARAKQTTEIAKTIKQNSGKELEISNEEIRKAIDEAVNKEYK